MAVPIISFANSTIQPTASPVQSLDSVINAKERGIRAGQQLPSVGSAIASGVITAVNAVQAFQDRELNNQLKEEQIESAQMRNDVAAMELAVVKQNEDVIVKSKALELENQYKVLQTANQDLDNRQVIEEALASPMQDVRKSVLTNPQLAGTLFRDPKYASTVIGRLTPDMTPDEQQQALASLDFVRKMELDNRLKEAGIRQRNSLASQKSTISQKAREDANVDALVGDLTDEQVKNEIELYPTGSMPTISRNGVDYLNPDPTAVPGQLSADVKTFDVFKNGKKIGTTSASTATKIKQIQKYQTNFELANEQDLGITNREKVNAREVPAVRTPQTPPVSDPNPLKTQITGRINLLPEQVQLIDGPTKEIMKFVDLAAKDRSFASRPENVATLNRNITQVATVISNNEYYDNKSLQEKYTPKAVEEYNKGLLESAMMANRSNIPIINLSLSPNEERIKKIYEPFLVKSPEELYFVAERGAVLKSNINSTVDNLIKKEREKLVRPFAKAQSQNSLINRINSNR